LLGFGYVKKATKRNYKVVKKSGRIMAAVDS